MGREITSVQNIDKEQALLFFACSCILGRIFLGPTYGAEFHRSHPISGLSSLGDIPSNCRRIEFQGNLMGIPAQYMIGIHENTMTQASKEKSSSIMA